MRGHIPTSNTDEEKKKNRAYNNEWVDRFTTALVCMHLICSCMIKKKKKGASHPTISMSFFLPAVLVGFAL